LAAAIIVMIFISLFATGIAIFSFQPAVFNLGFQSSFWEDSNQVDQNILQFRDVLYNASLAIPIFMIAVLFVWGYLSSSRQSEI
jgi:ABC-type uncharacterized transport system permease subunit